MQHDHFDLSGKVALVTGASRGIGESIARLLAEYGAHVIISSRKEASCESIASSLRDSGYSASTGAVNIGDADAVRKLVEGIGREHGHLDILVNNAATNPYFGDIVDTPMEAIQKTVDVNLRGYFVASAEAARIMREGDGGSIVNIASVNASRPAPLQGIYSITKGAVVNMTKAFAKECATQGIRVNAVLPGLTKTAFAGALLEDEKTYKSLVQNIPMRRHAEPDEIAGIVLYLASGAASYTTGAVIPVDGGLLA